VLAAVAELLHVLMIAAGVIVGIGVAAVAGLACVAVAQLEGKRGPHHAPLLTKVVRAAPPLPQAPRARELPAKSQRELPGGLHLHFHGVKAEDIAAILVRETLRERR
jgi:hypothetical protein